MHNCTKRIFAFYVCSVACIYASATMPLHGTVVDGEGNPVVGAHLEVGKIPGWWTKTGAGGYYNFPALSAHGTRRPVGHNRPVFIRDRVSFEITGLHTAVRLELYDIAGRSIATVVDDILPPKRYSFVVPVARFAASVGIVSLRIGNDCFTRKLIVDDEGSVQPGGESATIATLRSDSRAEGAVIDTLYCSKIDFLTARKGISSYYETVNFVMTLEDTIPPVIRILGDDTVCLAIQDTLSMLKYMSWDSIANLIELTDDQGYAFLSTVDYWMSWDLGKPGFATLPIHAIDGTNTTIVYIFLVFYDSTVTGDTVPPVLTIDPDTVRLTAGATFSLDSGVTAVDAVDSHITLNDWINITDDIKTASERNGRTLVLDVPGTYTVTYRIMDTHMNMAEGKRTIIVAEP
ncbi:MAG: hypothetical protein JXA18_06575 [Chitinispirillaceae bacterium]|nr:hypothetical protein [Chitinispirillaceae bacterium]